MIKCLKRDLFEYLASYEADSFGWAHVLPDRVCKDTGFTREELWYLIQNTKRQAFLDYLCCNLPDAEGLLAIGITQRGRLWLEGKDYSHIPEGREKVYNLL
jgi:hypothetical protein